EDQMFGAEHFSTFGGRGVRQRCSQLSLCPGGVAVECCGPGTVPPRHETEGLYGALAERFAEELVPRPSFVLVKSVHGGEPAKLAEVYRKADHVKCRHAACLSAMMRPSTTLRVPPCRPDFQFLRSGRSKMRSTERPVSGPSPKGQKAR